MMIDRNDVKLSFDILISWGIVDEVTKDNL